MANGTFAALIFNLSYTSQEESVIRAVHAHHSALNNKRH
jgi:hypothetical protein